MPIAENVAFIQQKIVAALLRRNELARTMPEDIKLIAVTKTQSVLAIQQAIDAGIMVIGENRVQEALEKYPALGQANIEWHLIGHLQTNKVRQAISLFQLIHSVDSEKLACEINRVAGKQGKRQDILVQVNVADESTKFGAKAAAVTDLCRKINDLEHIQLKGLMTIAPFYQDTEMVRPIFRELCQLFCEIRSLNLSNLQMEYLSMGMTNDYLVAIEEGANLIRIGTGIFGSRLI